MMFPRQATIIAVFRGPFFWLFTTRLLLALVLAAIGGIAFADELIALGALALLCSLFVVGTLAFKMLSLLGGIELTPRAQHVRNLVTIVEHTSNLGMVTDRNLRITWVNAAFTRITGYTAEEARGKTPHELLGDPIHGPSAESNAIVAAQAQGKPIRIEILNRKKNGELFWSDTDIQPILDTRQQVTGFIEIGVDITEQKNLLARLQEQTQQLQRLAGVARFTSNGVIIVGTDGRVVWFNAAAPSVLGLEEQDLEHIGLDEIKRSFDERHLSQLHDALRTPQNALAKAVRLELELAHNNAGRWLEAELQPLFALEDGQGDFEGWMLVMLDITSRKQQEEQLRMSEARLRAIYDVLPVGIAISDNEGRLVDCNQKAEEFLDIKRSESLGMRAGDNSAWTFTDEAGVALRADQLAGRIAFHTNVQVDNQIVRLATATKERWLSISATPIEDATLGVAVAYTDVSEQQRQYEAVQHARQQAEVASQGKSYFLANMSHEIRTPMNAIEGLLSLMRETQLSRKQRDYVDQTSVAAKSLLALLGDILDFSKAESGSMVLDPQPLSMPEFWSDLSALVQNSVERQDVELIFTIDSNIPDVLMLDGLRLQQILLNLLSNALKFTPVGWVELSVKWNAKRLHICVQDSGIGMPPEQQSRIFDGFIQTPSSSHDTGNTGLGLAITQKLVQLMGSQLRVQSIVDEGSQFSFVLECASVKETGTLLDLSSCLVVSSHERIRHSMATMAGALHAKVDVDSSPVQALRRLEDPNASPYHTLYLDVHQEEVNVWQVVQALDQMQALEASKIVFFVHPLQREHHFQHVLEHARSARVVLPRPATSDIVHKAVWEDGASKRGSAPSNKPLQGLDILVVEDNPINQQVVQEMLQKKGARVTLANHGEHALEVLHAALANATLPSIVLMDIQMPVMDGYTAMKSLRRVDAFASIAVLAMASNASVQDTNMQREHGFDGCIEKPFVIGDAVEIILGSIHSEALNEKDCSEYVEYTPSILLAARIYAGLGEKPVSEQERAQNVLRKALLECMFKHVPGQAPPALPIRLSSGPTFAADFEHRLAKKFALLAPNYALFLHILHHDLKSASPTRLGRSAWLVCSPDESLTIDENEPLKTESFSIDNGNGLFPS